MITMCWQSVTELRIQLVEQLTSEKSAWLKSQSVRWSAARFQDHVEVSRRSRNHFLFAFTNVSMKIHTRLKVGIDRNYYRINIKYRINLPGCFTKSTPNVQRQPIVMTILPAETRPCYCMLILTNLFIQ